MNYPSPCDTCTKPRCTTGGCEAWRIRWLYRWGLITGYAKKHGLIKPEEPVQIGENPCLRCTQDGICIQPCEARLKWWDSRMAQIRENLGGGSADKDT